MPGQKRKYNVRFPPGRIKKIMQKDTEVGRIAMAVPVIIARALEMFLKSLLTKTCLITQAKFNNIVSVAHMKQCIESEKLFHFLKDLAEGATSTATQKDNQGLSVWPPIHRNKKVNVAAKNPSGAGETVPQRSHGPHDTDSVSSVHIRLLNTQHSHTRPTAKEVELVSGETHRTSEKFRCAHRGCDCHVDFGLLIVNLNSSSSRVES
ncbi:PREDICTED: dr1-associated corepressor-like isoform X1 [Poecilia mexicana]|uniref:dr1-associated corepressor-like isoform X1 n=1 Tax=Poecilia mexicana TaxID=48701 RepID=UPI00072EBF44|nr:PREDICTED: dr1-associated corepressor-like isoform X1 [Poecilia mexicana]XP_014848102.1 PREDICTED: dr1-associated corepressor-like isoform X1 [Poecilia mexicana]